MKEAPIIKLDYRAGPTVEQLIEALQKIEDKTKRVAVPSYGLYLKPEGIQAIREIKVSGYA